MEKAVLIFCRPGSLNLPYDPTFLPETGLPGMGLDIILLDAITDEGSSQYSSIWSKSPANSHSSGSQVGPIQLDFSLEDLVGVNVLFETDNDINDLGQKGGLFGKNVQAGLEGEEGVLLHPDFEFDDNGDIVEFDASRLSPHRRRPTSLNLRRSEGPNLANAQRDTVSVLK
jgi:meiotic recombination protein REC8